nr:MAG TPA: hypothetical protein [Caudoviricetes sp.]
MRLDAARSIRKGFLYRGCPTVAPIILLISQNGKFSFFIPQKLKLLL